MTDLAKEVRAVVLCLLDNLRPIAEKYPKELTSTVEFNHVLGLAREVCPASPMVRDMKEFSKHASAIDVLIRLCVLHGALTAHRPART